jgi:nucleotide-binding universal stress UspA family protein
MKTLLTVIGDGQATALLETALLAARRFSSRIVGLNAVTAEYAVVFGGEMGLTISSEVDRSIEQESELKRGEARTLFHAFMARHEVPVGLEAEGGASAEWREEAGRQNLVVGTLGRAFDLIVLERPARLNSLAEATLEDALFESGRPVLMAPPGMPATLGERILVAWNGSSETARAVAMAMPFLEQARVVEVVSVEGGTVPGPLAEAVARTLAAHGMAVTARHVPAEGRAAGALYLDAAKAMNADLMIKGAYTQSRLRQLIFGGATRHILSEAPIPVLLAH